ncbi:hypothetical protein K474DRAFT_1567812, partial [Panus rudis PR-1116 ss-1]
REAGLRAYELSEEEWIIVQQLRDVLQVFYDATQFFSRDNACLSTVLPAMDKIDRRLATDSVRKSLKPCIRAACSMGLRTLNRYYDKTDYSDTYRISMVLHPQYKLEYFKQANWEQEWINTAV